MSDRRDDKPARKGQAKAVQARKAQDKPQDGGAPGHDLPDPAELTGHTPGELFDPKVGEEGADGVSAGDVHSVLDEFKRVQKVMQDADQLNDRSRESLADGMAKVYEQQQALYDNPALLMACVKAADLKTTKATWKSGSLVVVKLALPDLDAKTASQRARALNFCAAAGLTADQVREAFRESGVVELAKLEARRQKALKGEAGPQSDDDVIAQFVAERRPVPIDKVDLGERELAQLIVGRKGDEIVAYELDDNDRRLMAAVRGALKRGSQLINEGGGADAGTTADLEADLVPDDA
jgi:hypothetical protein